MKIKNKNRHINFLPSAAAGITDHEWDLFCEFYASKYGSSENELEVFDILDKIHEMKKSGTLEDAILKGFEIYRERKKISTNEGLTHPNEWIRTFTQLLAAKDRRS